MQKHQIRKKAKCIKGIIGSAVSLDSLTQYAGTIGYKVVYDTENLSPTAEFVDLNKRIICITNKLDETTAKHLLAHAIGHIVLNHKRIFRDETEQENEANYFACCLLKNDYPKAFKLILLFLILSILITFGRMSILAYEIKENMQETAYNQATTVIDEVVITRTGNKYHKPNCQYVVNKTDTLTVYLKEALEKGYEPCKICFE